MAFRQKSLLSRTSTRTNIFKYLTMFFLGASCVILATQAFNINSSLVNATEYIQQIILTADGSNLSTTGIILDGTPAGGITITTIPNALVLGTDPDGKIIASTAFNGLVGGRWTGNGIGDIYNINTGNVGVGIQFPTANFQVSGNLIAGDPMNSIAVGTYISSILGGSGNSVSGFGGHSIMGGARNHIYGGRGSSIGGGAYNIINNSTSGGASFIGGGQSGYIFGKNSFIGGGKENSITGDANIIGGGQKNSITSGAKSFIGGGEINTIDCSISHDNPRVDGAIVGGSGNQLLGSCAFSFIGGGRADTITGMNNTIAGGENNNIHGDHDAIGGGYGNTINPRALPVYMGYMANTIAGGISNTISGSMSATIPGGSGNNIQSGNASFVGGGISNNIRGGLNTIAGGMLNKIYGGDKRNNGYGVIGGGNSNSIMTNAPSNASYGVIGGGDSNSITGSMYGFIGGGGRNGLSGGSYNFVGGGMSNQITGSSSYSTIPGGSQNTITNAGNSLAGGKNAHVINANSFVWNSSSIYSFTSSKAETFLINAPGGVGIDTNDPQAALDVDGPTLLSGDITTYNSGSLYTGNTLTLTVNDPGGTTCDLTFVHGLLTSTSCPH